MDTKDQNDLIFALQRIAFDSRDIQLYELLIKELDGN